MDSGSASFTGFTLNQLLLSQGFSGGQGFAVSPGSCSNVTYRSEGENSGPVDPIKATPLDAGQAITVQRSGAAAKQLSKQGDDYSGKLGGGGIPGQSSEPAYLEPGSYTISAPGGTGPNSIGNFSVQYTLPQMVTWSNQAAASNVTRSAGQQITWTGGDPGGFVYMVGVSTAQNVAGMFYCIERASAGQFTIPSYVLSNLPATSGENVGFLMVGGSTNPTRFSARDLDAGYIVATSLSQQSVSYR